MSDIPRRLIVFVSRNMTGESLCHARAIKSLAGVCLLGIAEHLPDEGERIFEEVARVGAALEHDQ